MEASFPTTLAVLSALKGIRSSSQLRGLKTFTFEVLSAFRERSLDFRRIMLCCSPWTSIYFVLFSKGAFGLGGVGGGRRLTTTGAAISSMNSRFSVPSTWAANENSCTLQRRGIMTFSASAPPGPLLATPVLRDMTAWI